MAENAAKADLKTCPLKDIDFFDPLFLQNPHPTYERLRREAPVFRDPKNNIVYVSTYDLVMEVNRQPSVFSNRFGEQLRSGSVHKIDPRELEVMKEGWLVVDTMLTADPPEHTRYRKLTMKAFSYKRVLQMGAYVETVANDLIDHFIDKGTCEFKSAFANLLPMTVIADALGVSRSDMDRFAHWSDGFIMQLSGLASPEQRLDAARRIVAFQKYFVERIEEKRKNPTEDVISDLVHANLEEEGDPRHMDYAELLSIFQQLLVAGNETTAHSLTAGLYYLLQNPEQMRALIADPSLTDNFVEEVLRFLTPTNNMWRVVKHDTAIGGVPVKKNDLVLLRYGSANRDAGHFPEGDAFDIRRANAKEHLAFGAGIHTCIGAQLARKEMQVAFPIILRRLKNIRLTPAKNDFFYVPNILLRGVLALNIDFDR